MPDPKPAPGPQKTTNYPKNWERMTAGQKRKWLAENRPQTPATVQPARPAVAPTPAAPPADEENYDEEPAPLGENEIPAQEPCEEPESDEVRITIKIPGQDVRSMQGREIIQKILHGLYEAFGGATDGL